MNCSNDLSSVCWPLCTRVSSIALAHVGLGPAARRSRPGRATGKALFCSGELARREPEPVRRRLACGLARLAGALAATRSSCRPACDDSCAAAPRHTSSVDCEPGRVEPTSRGRSLELSRLACVEREDIHRLPRRPPCPRAALLHRVHQRAAASRPNEVARSRGPPGSRRRWAAALTRPSRACFRMSSATSIGIAKETHEAAGAAVDLGVDAHHFTAHVEERPARVAGVDRDVGLNEGTKFSCGSERPWRSRWRR